VAVVGIVAVVSVAAAQTETGQPPVPTSADQRVRIVKYDPNAIYELHARIGYQIELELEDGEEVLGQGAGDLAGIEVAAFGNHVFLKPKAEDVRTNLTIATNRRDYRFEYLVEAPSSTDGEAMYLVQFRYPPVLALPLVTQANRIDEALRDASAHHVRNIDYWYCGDAALRPIATSDDGVHTRVTFDVHAELPALFVRNDDGSESLLNFSMAEGDVVIHRVARRFIVRRGALSGCIVNQGFVGTGERLKSGTVTPEVMRARREVRPLPSSSVA
jgi:type IV secretion system protein VirB9